MKELSIKIERLEKIRPLTYLLSFKSSYIASHAKPGQFLHLKVDNKATILRRPFSLHRIRANNIYIFFKVRGRGTKILSQCKKGDTLDVIAPLGRGFSLPAQALKERLNVLIGGGMGVAPLLFLGERLRKFSPALSRKALKGQKKGREKRGLNPQVLVFLGAKTKKEIFCEKEFKKLGCKVYLSSEDGTIGRKSQVTTLLKDLLCAMGNEFDLNLYACGPKEMLLEIKEILKDYPKVNCQVAYEQFMGCGLGICSGCSIKTKDGYKKVCKDGPVFDLSEVILDNLAI